MQDKLVNREYLSCGDKQHLIRKVGSANKNRTERGTGRLSDKSQSMATLILCSIHSSKNGTGRGTEHCEFATYSTSFDRKPRSRFWGSVEDSEAAQSNLTPGNANGWSGLPLIDLAIPLANRFWLT
jgi:hypothetical protein